MLTADRLVTFALASFVLIVIPGPSVLFVVGRVIAHGRSGLAFVLFAAVLDSGWGLAAGHRASLVGPFAAPAGRARRHRRADDDRARAATGRRD